MLRGILVHLPRGSGRFEIVHLRLDRNMLKMCLKCEDQNAPVT